jgi:hypothetical protein
LKNVAAGAINGFETWYRQAVQAIVTDLAKQSKVVSTDSDKIKHRLYFS